MRLPKFDYRQPESIQEACAILLDQPDAKVLAGGTDLLVNMKHRVETPSMIVSLKGLRDLDYVRKANGMVRIGALTRLKKVYNDPFVAKKLPALAAAASSVGSYHHQTMGTLGGNLCQQTRCKYFNQSKWWRSARPLCFKAGGDPCHVAKKDQVCYSTYCGDVAPALLVLNAEVVLSGREGSKQVPLESIFSGVGKTPLNLEPGQILTEIVIPEQSADGFSTYKKIANRGSIDFPIVGAAVWTSASTGESRIALTAVDRKPVRTRQLEDFLKGLELNEETIQGVDGLVAKETQLMMSSIDSISYKRKLMGQLVKSALSEAMGGR
ncbi:MAG: FAD binding domain-containing protein [Desulfomonile tiedjei]|uniref:FAD binding domain-containing protein n=1 Tax=Desulfomonile tiedjei TaxID=2358 RepID=A0A9D6V751_9BACT|nr:FAD binding domain-containing protein [Desulfomonile tiedjei]